MAKMDSSKGFETACREDKGKRGGIIATSEKGTEPFMKPPRPEGRGFPVRKINISV